MNSGPAASEVHPPAPTGVGPPSPGPTRERGEGPGPAPATPDRAPSGSGPDAGARRRRWVIGTLLFVAAVVIPLLRQRGIPYWRTVFAEDGWIFLGDAEHSGLSSVGAPYNGYIQLVPRILALPAPWLRLTHVSIYFALVSSLFSAVAALLAYRCTKGWVASVPMRLLVALTVVLAAPLGGEVTGTLANTIWPAFAVLPWALVALNERKGDVTARAVFVFVAAASSALTVVFVPLAIGFVIWRRTRASAVVAAAYVAGLAVEVWSIKHTEFVTAPPINSVPELGQELSVRVAGSYVFGNGALPWLWDHLGLTVGVIATVVLVAALGVSFVRAPRRNAALALVFVGFAGLTFAVPAWLRGTNVLALVTPYFDGSSRYLFTPVLLLLSAFVLLLDAPDASRTRTVARVGRAVLVAQTIVVIALSFSITNARGDGPTWADSVTVGREQCQRQGGGEVDVPIVPVGWHVTLPCSRLAP